MLFCQINKKELIKKWESFDNYECRDFLDFKRNGVYFIFNDCAIRTDSLTGENTSVTEKGNWILKEDSLKLFNREFYRKISFQEFYGMNGILKIKLKKLTCDTLRFNAPIKKIDNYIDFDETYVPFGNDSPIDEQSPFNY